MRVFGSFHFLCFFGTKDAFDVTKCVVFVSGYCVLSSCSDNMQTNLNITERGCNNGRVEMQGMRLQCKGGYAAGKMSVLW